MQQIGFGDVLRRYRVAAGLTQEALAERAALSARGISDLERAARSTLTRRPYAAWPRRSACRKPIGVRSRPRRDQRRPACDAPDARHRAPAGMPADAAQQLRRSRA